MRLQDFFLLTQTLLSNRHLLPHWFSLTSLENQQAIEELSHLPLPYQPNVDPLEILQIYLQELYSRKKQEEYGTKTDTTTVKKLEQKITRLEAIIKEGAPEVQDDIQILEQQLSYLSAPGAQSDLEINEKKVFLVKKAIKCIDKQLASSRKIQQKLLHDLELQAQKLKDQQRIFKTQKSLYTMQQLANTRILSAKHRELWLLENKLFQIEKTTRRVQITNTQGPQKHVEITIHNIALKELLETKALLDNDRAHLREERKKLLQPGHLSADTSRSIIKQQEALDQQIQTIESLRQEVETEISQQHKSSLPLIHKLSELHKDIEALTLTGRAAQVKIVNLDLQLHHLEKQLSHLEQQLSHEDNSLTANFAFAEQALTQKKIALEKTLERITDPDEALQEEVFQAMRLEQTMLQTEVTKLRSKIEKLHTSSQESPQKVDQTSIEPASLQPLAIYREREKALSENLAHVTRELAKIIPSSGRISAYLAERLAQLKPQAALKKKQEEQAITIKKLFQLIQSKIPAPKASIVKAVEPLVIKIEQLEAKQKEQTGDIAEQIDNAKKLLQDELEKKARTLAASLEDLMKQPLATALKTKAKTLGLNECFLTTCLSEMIQIESTPLGSDPSLLAQALERLEALESFAQFYYEIFLSLSEQEQQTCLDWIAPFDSQKYLNIVASFQQYITDPHKYSRRVDGSDYRPFLTTSRQSIHGIFVPCQTAASKAPIVQSAPKPYTVSVAALPQIESHAGAAKQRASAADLDAVAPSAQQKLTRNLNKPLACGLSTSTGAAPKPRLDADSAPPTPAELVAGHPIAPAAASLPPVRSGLFRQTTLLQPTPLRQAVLPGISISYSATVLEPERPPSRLASPLPATAAADFDSSQSKAKRPGPG
ncbi:MAG: hypothetical protein K0S08_2215 [Gammaproteobacteria bacterium]|jgi:hypothetical protein|nr:hypothetical protein [Gammaproteobacteria bacterium]